MKIQLPRLKGKLAIEHDSDKGKDQATIIFLHDSLGCIQTWRDFPKALAEQTGCNYLVYDRLGYGASDFDPDARNRNQSYLEKEADILLSMIDQVQITKPILFGHSDGGSIALIAAAKSKSKLEGIIIEAGHIFVENITLAGIRNVKKYVEIWQLKERLIKYHGSKVDDVFDAWVDTWLSDFFRDWNIESFLPAITCPTLILQGKKDEFGTLQQVEGIQSGVKGPVEAVILENVGHSPHKENSPYTLKVTADFINNLQ